MSNGSPTLTLVDSNPFDDKHGPRTHIASIELESLKQGPMRETKPKARGNITAFLNPGDSPLLFFATITISITAVGPPLQSILYGQVFAKMAHFLGGELETSAFLDKSKLLCGLIMVVGFAQMIFTWVGIFLWMKIGESQQSRARKSVFKSLLTKDIQWFDNATNIMGDIAQANRCIEELRSGCSEVMGLLIQTVASVIALMITSLYHSWLLTIVIMAGTPIMGLLGWFFGSLTYKCALLENDYSSQASKVLDWSFVSGSLIRVLGAKYYEMVKFNKIVQSSAKAYFKLANTIALSEGVLKIMILMMFVQGFWLGTHLVQKGRLSISEVFTCFSSCLLLGTHVTKFNHLLAILNKAHAAVARINEMIEIQESDISDHEKDIKRGISFNSLSHIEFKHVKFQYPSRSDFAIDDISVTFGPGQMNFIVGDSGSGKSTLSQLLLGFYFYDSGNISINGKSLEDIKKKELISEITLIEQFPSIFTNSVKNNIGLAVLSEFDSLSDVPVDRLLEACKFACLDEVFKKLGNWDKTINKDSLSGGQKQRISLARARIRDTPILILDEAFSALDKRTSDIIFASLRKWRVGKTTIIITHDLSQISENDFVVTMENGKIKSQGFHRLSTRQFSEFVDSVNEISEMPRQENPPIKPSYLTNPVILQDLENSGERRPEKMMPIFSILSYCAYDMEHKWILLLGVFASIAEGVANPIFSYCFSKLLSTLVEASLGSKRTSSTTKWSVIVIGVALFMGASSYLSSFLLAFCSEKWIVSLRKRALLRINEQEMTFFDLEVSPAELTTLIMNDTRDLRSLVAQFISSSVNLVTLVLVGITWSVVSGWKLALVGICFVPVVLLITALYGKLLSHSERKYKDNVVIVESHVHETITGIRTIFGLNLEEHFASQFFQKIDNLLQKSLSRSFHTGLGEALSELCVAIAIGVILLYGMVLVGKGEYSAGKLLQVITLLTFTISSSGVLLNQLPEITRGQRAGSFIIKLLQMRPSETENDGNLKPIIVPSKPIIEFNNLKFCFPLSSRPSLSDISFSVARNQVTGILGSSGSGKSTLGSVLMRLYRVSSNSIYINGRDINSWDIDWLRSQLTLVPQHPKVFPGSIHENLTYGLGAKIEEAAIYDALRLTNLEPFVLSLPEGLETQIGETTMSGGQLQRLCITRGLLRRPEILILDECTSNLDPENVQQICDLINRLRGYMTIIILTHEEKLMRVCDYLVVLKNGEMSEQGTFNELGLRGGELSTIAALTTD